ncbi:MAG: hypothetical protein RI886_1092 [Pseudomonadota bacterium]
MLQKIITSKAGNHVYISFNRPDKRNALDAESWDLLAKALKEVDSDNAIYSATLKGDQHAFCSGVDIASMLSDDANHYEKPFNECIEALKNFSKPLLALVEGPAVGGGATILLHCDAVFLSPKARIKYPFTELGLVTELGSSALLQNALGYRKSFELLSLADWISADEYILLGLGNYAGDDFEEKYSQFINAISNRSINAIKEIKFILKSLTKEKLDLALRLESEGMKKLFGSDDNLTAVQEFKK